MNGFAETLAADRRLSILLLDQAPGASASASLLHAALPGLGHAASLDAIETDLAWLAEQGLVAVSDIGGLTVAKLLARGADAAAGRARVPGLKRRLLP